MRARGARTAVALFAWLVAVAHAQTPVALTHVHGLAYSADADIELVIQHDLNPITYTLPATGGEYLRVHAIFQAAKGKAVNFQWSSELPFRLYKSDCSVRVQGWGAPGGYQVVNPFGGPHYADGAGI